MVSSYSYVHIFTFYWTTLKGGPIRLACSQLYSPHLSSIVLKIYNRLPLSNQRTSRNNQLCSSTRSPNSFLLSVHKSPSPPIYHSQIPLSVRQSLMSG